MLPADSRQFHGRTDTILLTRRKSADSNNIHDGELLIYWRARLQWSDVQLAGA